MTHKEVVDALNRLLVAHAAAGPDYGEKMEILTEANKAISLITFSKIGDLEPERQEEAEDETQRP